MCIIITSEPQSSANHLSTIQKMPRTILLSSFGGECIVCSKYRSTTVYKSLVITKSLEEPKEVPC